MSYLVLARKYRSRDFESLVGQSHVVQALGNALTQQRLHHAYLFTGTRGVGKTSVSRILAKALNCTGTDGQGGITAKPCGVCEACRDIDSGRFVDYVELDAASNRGVEEISQLLDQAVYKPVMGRFKVYMIDEVHMLSNTAFNAMLKTLEEPPEYLKFVLATTDPQKVPPTVLSRCLQFNLRPMAPSTVQEHLAHVLAAEQIEAEPGALRLLARAARGSMRDALSLTDQAIAYGSGRLAEAGVRQMLGAVDRTHAVRLVEAVAAGRGADLVGAVEDLRGLGLSAVGTLEEMAALLQQMAVVQAVAEALDPDDPDAATVARLSGLLAADEVQLFYSIVLHGRAELGLAPDEYSGLVMVLLRMLTFRPADEGARARTASAAPRISSPPAAVSTAKSPVPAIPERDAASPVLCEADPAQGAATPAVAAKESAQPAVVGRPPQARVPAKSQEPPAWLDEAPFDDEGTACHPPSRTELPIPQEEEQAEAAGAAPSLVAHERPAAVEARTLVPTPLGERWAELVAQMSQAGRISALSRELAMQAECIEACEPEGSRPALWRLRVEREMLRASSHRDKVQAALSEALGHPVQLVVDLGLATDSPALRASALRLRRQAEAEQTIQNDPLVQSLMQQFKTARIVPGSVKFH